jgi:hypothetical protein
VVLLMILSIKPANGLSNRAARPCWRVALGVNSLTVCAGNRTFVTGHHSGSATQRAASQRPLKHRPLELLESEPCTSTDCRRIAVRIGLPRHAKCDRLDRFEEGGANMFEIASFYAQQSRRAIAPRGVDIALVVHLSAARCQRVVAHAPRLAR